MADGMESNGTGIGEFPSLFLELQCCIGTAMLYRNFFNG